MRSKTTSRSFVFVDSIFLMLFATFDYYQFTSFRFLFLLGTKLKTKQTKTWIMRKRVLKEKVLTSIVLRFQLSFTCVVLHKMDTVFYNWHIIKKVLIRNIDVLNSRQSTHSWKNSFNLRIRKMSQMKECMKWSTVLARKRAGSTDIFVEMEIKSK